MPRKINENGFSLAEIAETVKGELIGDPEALVYSICPIDEPEDGCLCFSQKKRLRKIREPLTGSMIKGLIVRTDFDYEGRPDELNLILASEPLAAVVRLIPLFFKTHVPEAGISLKAEIHPTAEIAENVKIGPFVSISAGVIIEEDVTIYPHVTVYPGVHIGSGSTIHAGAIIREDCRIGAKSMIQNGAVIGADGFGYISGPTGEMISVPQVGTVCLGDGVDVGANSCIDRATIGSTIVSKGTKLDNLVQIGHNTKIGEHSILCGQVGIAGSCKIGKRVVLGGNAGVADHISITDGCRLGAKSGVVTHLKESGDYAGFPAIPANMWRKSITLFRKLPKLLKKLDI